jgi:hypothetical protein
VHARSGRQCSATCGCPGGQWRVAGGASASVASPHGTLPIVVNVTHRSTPAQRSDRWTFRPLGVRARRGYGAYGGASDVSCPGATSCAGARLCTNSLIYPFCTRAKLFNKLPSSKVPKDLGGFFSLVQPVTSVHCGQKLGACEQWFSALICIFHELALQTSNATQQRSCVP